MMDWDKLRIFHVVAQAGSFTHAGERLNLSQSAVSRQISTLEQTLGVQLFTRHARGLILTSEGETLHKTVSSVFAQIAATHNKILESHDDAKGELKVACSIGVGSIWLPKRLSVFSEMFPNIRLTLVLTDNDVDFSMREADVAIGYGHFKQPNITSEVLRADVLKLYASEGYLEDYGTPSKVQDLDFHRLIVFGTHKPPPYEGVNFALKIGADTGHVREPYIAINNAYAILQCIQQGLGIGALPNFIAKDYKDLIPVLSENSGTGFDFCLQYPEQLKDSRKVQAFREFIKIEMDKTS